MSDIRQVLISEGLDPAFGFLHQPVPGRESLVLDFTELFRGAVDFAMYLLIQQLEPDDFTYTKADGCRLTKAARPIYFKAWSEFREQCPRFSIMDKEIIWQPLTEQIRSKVMQFRELMKTFDKEPV